MPELDPVADIKSRLSIEDVVAKYVPLKRVGRSLKACCPFHSEKTPSFIVSPERQLAYCFGCNKGGDMFTFVQEIEGVDFKGALDVLADQAGLDLSRYKSAPVGPRVSKDHKDQLFELNEAVSDFYGDQLFGTKEGAKVIGYLEGRGFTAETIRAFGLGLSPDSFEATYQHLVQKNYTKSDLLELGLLLSRDTGSRDVYDRFRRRLMFPIHDGNGKLIGFGGRALKSGDDPKYMNSPESPIYHKGHVVYGLHRAKAAIREKDSAVFVEGYMDVMASHQAGIRHVVATSGTALTVDQIKLVKRLTHNVSFAFDTDRAGEEALFRAILLGQGEGLHMRVVRVPEGKDPDECIHQNPALWEQALVEAPHYLDYYLQVARQRFEAGSIEAKREACDYFAPLLKNASSLERDHFIRQLAFILKTEPSFLYEEFNKLQKDRFSETRATRSLEKISPKARESLSNEMYLFALLLRFPEQIKSEFLSVPEESFDEPFKKVYKILCDQYNERAFVDVAQLFDGLEEDLRKELEVLMLFAEKGNAELSEEVIAHEIQRVAARTLQAHRTEHAKTLMHQIKEAQTKQDSDRERELFQEYSRLFQA